MGEVFRFPKSKYEVKVFRKQDILDCIDENILDKEVALEIVKQCEIDAANFIKEGRWTGIPYIGNIRSPKYKEILETDEFKTAIEDVKSIHHDKESYVLFRHEINKAAYDKIRYDRHYRFVISRFIGRNKDLYKRLCTTKGEHYARLFAFISSNINVMNDRYFTFEI